VPFCHKKRKVNVTESLEFQVHGKGYGRKLLMVIKYKQIIES
jgi:hypothetical protein